MEWGGTGHPTPLDYLDQRRSPTQADESPATDQDDNALLSTEREVVLGEA
jgi:hypothetical protein